MSQSLPTGGFEWVANSDSLQDCTSTLAKEAGKDFLLEVDVSYTNNLHDLQNDLPFMCQKMKINGVQKLVPSLFHKKRYVIHVMALD